MFKRLKKLTLAIMLLCFGYSIQGQLVQRESIGSLGGSSIVNNTYFHECVAQPYQTLAGNTEKTEITPGFVQPLVSAGIVVEDEISFISYPNPVRDILNIQWTVETINTIIRVYNSQGVIVGSDNIIYGTSTQMNFQQFSAGLYIVEIQQNKSVNRVSIIKI
jgi:hypothetical protein